MRALIAADPDASLLNYLVRMRRLGIYLALVLAAGLVTSWWFVMTEEVDPAATEPGAFGLFLMIFTVAAMVGVLVLCLVTEIVVRLLRHRNRTSR